MKLHVQILPYQLHFKKPARTSRGVYQHRNVWFVTVSTAQHPKWIGIGECAPLPELSVDFCDRYEIRLKTACNLLAMSGVLDYHALQPFPSILFGLETALQHLQRQQELNAPTLQLWDSPFHLGKQGIPINGLIWMDNSESMKEQIKQKVAEGFRCIKLKIGALDFEKELALIGEVRRCFSADEITLRLDANGAFTPEDAQQKLERLAEYDIHSIEQPIAVKLWPQLQKLIQTSPIPIALDEELIGLFTYQQKLSLLTELSPHYLVLKPSLHGGIIGTKEWITLAEQANVGWWMTSALESNVGLNAIAQFTELFHPSLPQGLGTGLLYHNNVPIPLSIYHAELFGDPAPQFSFDHFISLLAKGA